MLYCVVVVHSFRVTYKSCILTNSLAFMHVSSMGEKTGK